MPSQCEIFFFHNLLVARVSSDIYLTMYLFVSYVDLFLMMLIYYSEQSYVTTKHYDNKLNVPDEFLERVIEHIYSRRSS